MFNGYIHYKPPIFHSFFYVSQSLPEGNNSLFGNYGVTQKKRPFAHPKRPTVSSRLGGWSQETFIFGAPPVMFGAPMTIQGGAPPKRYKLVYKPH